MMWLTVWQLYALVMQNHADKARLKYGFCEPFHLSFDSSFICVKLTLTGYGAAVPQHELESSVNCSNNQKKKKKKQGEPHGLTLTE